MNPNHAMAAQYRTYPQQQRPPAHPAAIKGRVGIAPMNSQIQLTAAQSQQMLQHQAQRRNEASEATTRAKKPTDRNMPEGVEDIAIGEGVAEYKKLRDFERRLDAIMMRKRLELNEKRTHSSDRKRKLRIWISNTAENQPWQGGSTLDEGAFDFNTGADARYRVKIVGKLLEEEDPDEVDLDDEGAPNGNTDSDAMDHDGEGAEEKKPEKQLLPQLKLSHFFKKITVDLDRSRSLLPDGANVIEWRKPQNSRVPNPPPAADFDTLEFERKSDENINCTINFFREEEPQRFALSKQLGEIIDAEEATREEIISGIWEYSKAMDLQQDEEKRTLRCDDKLRAVFQSDSIYFPNLGSLIAPHISELSPVSLPYTIRVDQEYQTSPTQTVYDIIVPGPDPTHAKMLAMIQNPDYTATLQQLASLDNQLAYIIQGIADSKARHSFFTSMSKDPARFIKRWASSQQKDLEVIMGDSRYGSGQEWVGEEFRRGGKDGVWGSQNVRESVGLMVARK